MAKKTTLTNARDFKTKKPNTWITCEEDPSLSYTIVEHKDGSTDKIIIDTYNVEKASQYRWSVAVFKVKNVTNKYAMTCIRTVDGQETVYLAHIICERPSDLYCVDHINATETLNNSERNLRLVSYSENSLNRKRANCYMKSGPSTYLSRIKINGEQISLGIFKSKEEASKYSKQIKDSYIKKQISLEEIKTLKEKNKSQN